MKIRSSLSSGFWRALRSWKGVLLVWLFSLILVSLLVVPFRGAFRSAFGSSMITGKLAYGFDLETFMDLGPTLRTIFASLSSGFLFVLLISFLLNAFLTGGLFDSLKKGKERFSYSEFFSAGSKNFWPFLLISLTISFIIVFVSGAITGITAAIIAGSETISEKNGFIFLLASFVLAMLLLPLFILVADYARARKATDEKISGLKAIGYGFSKTFSSFWTSYPMMLILIFCQLVFGAFIVYLIPVWRPVTGKGVLLLFLVSQVLVFIRLFLKTWRYGSVTAHMES